MRQETTVTTYYEFSELSDKQKINAIEKYRDVNVSYDGWHDDTLSDFKDALEILGFKKVVISYSGFSSQGDGANFTGEFLVPSDEDTLEMRLEKVKSEHPWLHKDNESLFKHYEEMTFSDDDSLYFETCDVYRIGHHYSHSNTITCDHDGVKEFARSFSDLIYKTLEKEYESLRSDEQVIETIECNSYEFTVSEVGEP